ncbi:hypothetical protein FRACYDRAFT_253530 [Fragilariopsis cylindrus CCMP1102]|uniref:Uncharacterized protein n=1 Tax=Fragilariopsis cylindrus CCMP1102 TaxID=635003 RepID=A0A1E7ELF9_9STRA|nr:hypothetical protein FRACYDRAFT_253530 [Fragilariopsis cylindrus CCMP1102]|eukprot:OEU06752.1 hypothetical protein FRACYDRAFT_253530 [Fragilariopsis cylindrus CCMP1102]
MDNDNKHDDDDAIRRLQPRPSSSSRPLLIFNHNPKAGGGSVLKTIRGFKTNEIQCRSGNRKESGCQPNQWDRINRIISFSSNLKDNNNNSSLSSFSSNNNNNNTTETDTINNTFIHIGEFSRTTAQDKERGYIIGTIREPCSQYVSLWSFGSFNNGAFRNYQVRDTELYGQSPPYFNTTEDIQRFHKWMNHPSVIGEIGRRVTVSYGNDDDDNDNDNNSIVNNVDCWVVVENFQQTLFDCLNRYENQGGYVDWTSTTLSQLKEKVQVQEEEENNNNNNSHHHHHSRRHLGGNSRIQSSRKFKRFYNKGSKKRKNDHLKDDHSKDDPIGDPRKQHHASCHIFFATTTTTQNDNDNYLIQQVMSPKNELFIYQQFGYDRCCTTNIPTIVGGFFIMIYRLRGWIDNLSCSSKQQRSNR